jgi:hypothetical protein
MLEKTRKNNLFQASIKKKELSHRVSILPDGSSNNNQYKQSETIKRNLCFFLNFFSLNLILLKGFTSANKQKPQKVVITETKDGSCDVKFYYNKTVVEILKKIDGQYRTFDKGTKLWKINRLHWKSF